ncbi:MAG: hypothetical protein AABX71_00665 [Nanoarchaeota archaeon]
MAERLVSIEGIIKDSISHCVDLCSSRTTTEITLSRPNVEDVVLWIEGRHRIDVGERVRAYVDPRCDGVRAVLEGRRTKCPFERYDIINSDREVIYSAESS